MISFYLYKKQERYTGQDWADVIPQVLSPDGDGTMPLVIKSNDDSVCKLDYSFEYLTFESLEDNNIFVFNGNQQDIAGNKTVEYSTDGGQTWTSLYNGDSVEIPSCGRQLD